MFLLFSYLIIFPFLLRILISSTSYPPYYRFLSSSSLSFHLFYLLPVVPLLLLRLPLPLPFDSDVI